MSQIPESMGHKGEKKKTGTKRISPQGRVCYKSGEGDLAKMTKKRDLRTTRWSGLMG